MLFRKLISHGPIVQVKRANKGFKRIAQDRQPFSGWIKTELTMQS